MLVNVDGCFLRSIVSNSQARWKRPRNKVRQWATPERLRVSASLAFIPSTGSYGLDTSNNLASVRDCERGYESDSSKSLSFGGMGECLLIFSSATAVAFD